jgi:hypothetical protein
MHSASELADWWDRKTKESDNALLEFVDTHPNLWVIGAVAQTGMEFAGVMVFDIFRFGEGAAESYETGKIAPLVQDVFRGMSIAGGLGKAAQFGRAAVGKTLSLYANVAGRTCAPIAMGNALRRTGQLLFLSLEEIAAAHGVSLNRIAQEGANMASSIAALRKLGVSFDVLRAVSWSNVVARLMQSEGVMMIRIIGSKGGAEHRIILQKMGGVVKILDRYGEFADLDALSCRYASALKGGKFIIDPAADAVFVKRIFSMLVNGLPTLMIEANAVVHLSEETTVPDLDRVQEAPRRIASHPLDASARGHCGPRRHPVGPRPKALPFGRVLAAHMGREPGDGRREPQSHPPGHDACHPAAVGVRRRGEGEREATPSDVAI